MDLALWIVAGLLALLFLFAGANKLLIPYDKLKNAPLSGWVSHVDPRLVKTIGAFEVLGALGLILPGVTGTAPILVPVAALGIAVIMSGAAILHVRLRDPKHMIVNLFYLALALFVAIGSPVTGISV
ncbi:DoxX family protein [Occultella glacieicola]|uniref:DoxX family protein n=1 Tax=Occultella glacieicola TaxID=2518684 RepID=A0ABY2E6X8_9MICO|nr:DoxX family protein [Occultella glacieicola]TDE97312.1 DoxX family protein [Occultella glacieicola]